MTNLRWQLRWKATEDGSWLYSHSYLWHIFDLSLQESVCPQAWREAKFIPLPKSGEAAFTGSNSRTISLLPALSRLLKKNCAWPNTMLFLWKQITTYFQHAYREGRSTCTTLTQMTDDWLKQMNNKKIVGAVQLDFIAAFDMIDHKLLLWACVLRLFNLCHIVDSELSILQNSKGFPWMEASLTSSM